MAKGGEKKEKIKKIGMHGRTDRQTDKFLKPMAILCTSFKFRVQGWTDKGIKFDPIFGDRISKWLGHWG